MSRLLLTILPLLCLAIVIMPNSAAHISYLHNGTFANDLKDWKLKGEAFIVIDPSHRGNKCLKVAHIDAPFALSQPVKIPSGVHSMTLNLRVQAQTASTAAPVELRFMASNDQGIAAVANWTVAKAGEWQQLSCTLHDLHPGPVSMAFEIGNGSGELLMDDIAVR